MFSNFFAAESEEVYTPSYLDRIVEAAESAKDRMNEISEGIANTVAEGAASPKDALESLVTSAKDVIGEFAIPTRESYETTAGDASSEDAHRDAPSPLAAVAASAKEAVGEFTTTSVAAEGDSAKDGARSPREIISAYAATAKDAIIEHAIAMKETVAESTMLANEQTYYVETTYAMETSAAEKSEETAGSVTDAIKEGAASIGVFASAATDAALGGAASAAEAISDGVASARETVIETALSVNGATVEGVTSAVANGVFSAKDTVVEGAMAAVEAATGESTVNDAEPEAQHEDSQLNDKSWAPISTGTALTLIGSAALPAAYMLSRKSE